jgi:hypothetical protein
MKPRFTAIRAIEMIMKQLCESDVRSQGVDMPPNFVMPH